MKFLEINVILSKSLKSTIWNVYNYMDVSFFTDDYGRMLKNMREPILDI